MKKQILYFVLAFVITACNQSQTNSGNQTQAVSGNQTTIDPGTRTQTDQGNQTHTDPGNQTQANSVKQTQTETSVPKEQQVQVASNIQLNFERTFQGQIDAKHDIVLKINAAGGKITGTYFYKISKTEIKVEGNLDNRGNLTLTESNQFNTITGHFTGMMTNNNKIAGTWRNANGDIQLPFAVSEIK